MLSVVESVVTTKSGQEPRQSLLSGFWWGGEGFLYPLCIYGNPESRVTARFEGIFRGYDKSYDNWTEMAERDGENEAKTRRLGE
jgi:hypothetical protein